MNTTWYGSSHTPFHGASLSSCSKRELSTKNFAFKNFFSQVMGEDCKSSGWLYESERKTVSLEYQVAPLTNCAYLRKAPAPGSLGCASLRPGLGKTAFTDCLEKLQVSFPQSDCLWPQHFSLPQALCPFCQPWLSNHSYFLVPEDRRGNVNFLLTNLLSLTCFS